MSVSENQAVSICDNQQSMNQSGACAPVASTQKDDLRQQHCNYAERVTDTASALIFYADSDEYYRFANRAHEVWFNRPHHEITGRKLEEILGASYSVIHVHIMKVLGGNTVRHECIIRHAEKGDRILAIVHAPDIAENGQVRGFSSIALDITEDQLHRRELEFKTLVENSPDVIVRLDRAMRHLYVSPAIEAAFGLKAGLYLGRTKDELGFPENMVLAWNSAAQTAFTTGKEQQFESSMPLEDKIRHFSTRVIPEPDRSGNIDSLLCITYDITERTKMENERTELLARERTARIHAEIAARARDEFLAIVSHELRAPLNGIQSWAHVLENYTKDAASAPLAQRALRGIKTGVEQQVRLIEDLLDVTRMMSGKLRLVKQPLALLPVIQAATESVRGELARKNITLACEFKITYEQIEGDADRIQQIIWNLLSNAIKFTLAEGQIWVGAYRTDHEACITIRDGGIGISPDFLPRLFDRFSQEDTSSTRGYSGLGLGLFLVRHLVELHGGRVEAHSEGENKGATFSVYLPLRTELDKYAPANVTEDGANNQVTLPSLNGLHILLIDDQEDARESLAIVLGNAGAHVFAASSAKEALAWLSTLADTELPNVFVCDIAMPGEDGYSVLRKIRGWKKNSDLAPLQRIPALALTAFSQREDRIRALAAGFQMHMTKPVAPEELILVIATMTPRG